MKKIFIYFNEKKIFIYFNEKKYLYYSISSPPIRIFLKIILYIRCFR